MDKIDPAEPIDRIDPVDPIDRIDPLDPMPRIDPEDPFEPCPAELFEPCPAELFEPCLSRMASFSQPPCPLNSRRVRACGARCAAWRLLDGSCRA